MTKMMRHSALTLLLFLLTLTGLAQAPAGQPEMADALRADGKFWVVVVVVAIVTLGMFGYLIRLDGKIRRLEERTGRDPDGMLNR